MASTLIIAASNNTIFNSIVIKESYYKYESVDLLIVVQANRAGFDSKMYELLKQNNIFSNVYIIENNDINFILKKSCNSKYKRILYKYSLKNFLKNNLQYLIEKKYKYIICPMFTQYIPHIIESLMFDNNTRIYFYEEGTSTYDARFKQLIYFDYYKPKPTEIIKRLKINIKYLLNDYTICRKLYNNLDNRIYLYWPEHISDGKKSFFKLKNINELYEAKKFLHSYFCNIDYVKQNVYQKSKVIFFATYIPETEIIQKKAIDIIINNINRYDIVLKMHPSSTQSRLSFASDKDNEVYVDRDLFYFEALNVDNNFSNKIFIAINTSVVMNLKQMFGEEPYVIFLYKLTPFYYLNEHFKEVVDRYVSDLKKSYSDPSKIVVPSSMYEFEYVVKDFYRRVHNINYSEGKDNGNTFF